MEELEVLESIYLDDIKVEKDERDFPVSIQLQLHPATGDELDKRYVCMTLTLRIPKQYPNEVPEIIITKPLGIADEEVQSLLQELEKLAEDRVGEEMLYEIIELAKESLTDGNIPYCPCTICCEHFTEDDVFTKTDCYHYFHNHCLRRYIEHKLEVLQQERDGHVQHTQKNTEDEKIKCPVCRKEISYDLEDLQSEVYDKTKDEITFQPSDDFKIWQKKMAELYLKQKEKGGIIDVDAEKNRYLLTDSDNDIPIIIANTNTDKNECEENRPAHNEKGRGTRNDKGRETRNDKDRETHHDNYRGKESGPFKFNHGYGRGSDRKEHGPQNHRFSNRHDRSRPTLHQSAGSDGYSKGDNSRPSSSGGHRYEDRTNLRMAVNSRSPRSDQTLKIEKEKKENVKEKCIVTLVDNSKNTVEKEKDESPVVGKTESTEAKSENSQREKHERNEKYFSAKNDRYKDRHNQNRPSSSQHGGHRFSRGNNSRPFSARHGDRDGFHRGNNSVSPRSSVTSQLDGKIKENNEEGNKMLTHAGKQSESAVSGEKKMNEIKSEIVLAEMKEDKLPVDKKTSTKNVSDGKNTGHVVNHSKYDENRDGKNSKLKHDETECKKNVTNSSKDERKHRGRGQRRHAGQDNSVNDKGQGYRTTDRNQHFVQRKGRDYDYGYDYEYDYGYDYEYQDRKYNSRRGQGNYRGGHGHHKEWSGQGHRYRDEEKKTSSEKYSDSTEKSKSVLNSNVMSDNVDRHPTKKSIIPDTTMSNSDDTKVKSASIRNDLNRKGTSQQNEGTSPQSKGTSRQNEGTSRQDEDTSRQSDKNCDILPEVDRCDKPVVPHTNNTSPRNHKSRVNHKPPGFIIKGPPPGLSGKSVNPPLGLHVSDKHVIPPPGF